MKIAIPAETESGETRVAATGDSVKRLIGLGAEVAVEKGAGAKAGIPDSEFVNAGAKLAGGAKELLADADVVLKVRRPTKAELKSYKPGTIVMAFVM